MLTDSHACIFRTAYKLSSMFVQFLLPLLIVFAVYLSILCRLRHRPQSQHSENNRRRRRTNIMIILISVSFFLSWLPLNVFNTVLNFDPDFMEKHLEGEVFLKYILRVNAASCAWMVRTYVRRSQSGVGYYIVHAIPTYVRQSYNIVRYPLYQRPSVRRQVRTKESAGGPGERPCLSGVHTLACFAVRLPMVYSTILRTSAFRIHIYVYMT